ncbi:MAG: outer membrane protein assembly factor BamA [Casimicrobiaceae bacterium]
MRRLPSLVAALLALVAAATAFAFDPFVVKDIRVEGVQRTDAGTVFSYLPIKVGDSVDDDRAAQAVKALFATGFFRDVRLEKEGDVLVVVVQERPTISRLEFSGNKEFDTETLRKALREIGISEARIFDRSALDRAEQEMKRQYITRGLYGARVTTTVTPQERNRVSVLFTLEEGDAAKIENINIIGAKAFSERGLLREMQLTTPGWMTWYTKNDQYSKQKLQADLEALRSYYQDRGYLEFAIDSTQVSISPDKRDIYITVNITEGPRYTISDVKLAGELTVPEPALRALVKVRPGDVYSRARLQQTAKDISDRLGQEGYAFANVNAVPELDRERRTAAFTIFIDSGRRVYVRRINISGNTKTRDEVVRREMRQLEGAWFDSSRIERSKVRIRRLGFFEDVNIETPPVPGATDQTDVDVTVVEKATGNLLAGVGYSSSDGIVFNASVSQQNIFGSGNALIASLNTSKINRTISLAFTEPYWTVDGISRTLELYQKNIDPTTRLVVSQYSSSTIGTAATFGVPITETDSVNFGGRYEHTKLTLLNESPPVYLDFANKFGLVTDSIIGTIGWARDTRDDIIYPSKGRLQSVLLEVGLPPGDLHYYKFNYLHQWFTPVYGGLVLTVRGDFGYGGGYSGRPLPFFKAFFGGGVGSVRGYETSSLGPQDIFGNAIGGRRKIVGNVEMYYPIIRGDKAVRLSAFADAGQIYADGKQPQFESFRYSAGVGLAWNSPIGPLKFSYGVPLKTEVGDRLQRFQFQLGTVF